MPNPLPLPALIVALLAEGLAQIQLTSPAAAGQGATLRALPAQEGQRALEVWSGALGWQPAGHAAPLPGAAPAVVLDPPTLAPALQARPELPTGSVEVRRARLSPWGEDGASLAQGGTARHVWVPLALRARVAQAAAAQAGGLNAPELVVFVSPGGRFLQGLFFEA